MQRFDIRTASPTLYKAMLALSQASGACGLDHALLELVKIRASQINGCAFCLGMHVTEARKAGLSDDRMLMLPVWRETTMYTPRERAALAWTEALTRLENGEVPDAVYDAARAQFSEAELSDLSFAVAVINGWNRLMVASRTPPAG